MKHIEVYQNGEDNGWLHRQNYWFDPTHEHGFGIVSLDSIYPKKYFETDHVKPETIEHYCRHVMSMYEQLTGTNLIDAVEFGSAGGWFLKRFEQLGVKMLGIEGSTEGIIACENRGCNSTLMQHDLRLPINLNKAFDIALCTEVAEHIEPPFSSVLVKSLVDASDIVWFSFEEPNTNPAHIHHPNEMPDIFWINLFAFYGYSFIKIPQWITDKCEGRGMFIFYNSKIYDFNIVL